MNQMELNTHEIVQHFLPRIAVALEDIAKELKKYNIQQETSVNSDECVDSDECVSPSIAPLTQQDIFKMLSDAGIPVEFDDDNDVILSNGELILVKSLAFLTVCLSTSHQIVTTGANIPITKVTVAHIRKFIEDYKKLEKEL